MLKNKTILFIYLLYSAAFILFISSMCSDRNPCQHIRNMQFENNTVNSVLKDENNNQNSSENYNGFRKDVIKNMDELESTFLNELKGKAASCKKTSDDCSKGR